MRIEKLRLDQVEPNPWNPNQMKPDKRKALRRMLGKIGYVQPILVRQTSGEAYGDPEARYQIIDGEHRYDALRDEGAYDAEFVIVDDVEDADAKLVTLAMNQIRGTAIPMRQAELLVDLRRELGADALKSAGFSDGELEKAEELAGPIADDMTNPEPLEEPRRFSVTLAAGNYDEVMAAIRRAKEVGEIEEDSLALVAMAREFLSTYPDE